VKKNSADKRRNDASRIESRLESRESLQVIRETQDGRRRSVARMKRSAIRDRGSRYE
jgi:hypothetical protein